MKGKISNKIIYYDEVDSTQKIAKELITSGTSEHGLVICAKTQTEGIGRLDRKWISPIGGLWITTIYQGKFPLELFQGFSVFLGMEIVERLEKELHLEFKIKWPNDLILNNKKIGGILIDIISQQDSINYLIIGIGINLNVKSEDLPIELSNNVTSLLIEQNYVVDLDDILKIIIEAQNDTFEKSFIERNIDIWGNWPKKSFTYNSEVVVDIFDEKVIGIEKGITSKGELVISFETGETRKISVGEIQLLRKSN